MNPQKSRLLVGAAMLAMLPLTAQAQQTAKGDDVLELDAVVVTASRDGATKMNSSISIKILRKSCRPFFSFCLVKSVWSKSPQNIILESCPTLVIIVSNSWKFKF